MDNIIVEIKDDTVYCYKKDNSYTNKIINQYTNILLDLCNIISGYYNSIVIDIDVSVDPYILEKNCVFEMKAQDEYIDFKHFMHHWSLYGNKYWNVNIENFNSTILTSDADYNCYHNLPVFNKYLVTRHMTIPDYFDGYFDKFNNYNIQIKDNSIIITEPIYSYSLIGPKVYTATILDHDLFLCLIMITKKIIENGERLHQTILKMNDVE